MDQILLEIKMGFCPNYLLKWKRTVRDRCGSPPPQDPADGGEGWESGAWRVGFLPGVSYKRRPSGPLGQGLSRPPAGLWLGQLHLPLATWATSSYFLSSELIASLNSSIVLLSLAGIPWGLSGEWWTPLVLGLTHFLWLLLHWSEGLFWMQFPSLVLPPHFAQTCATLKDKTENIQTTLEMRTDI